VDSVHLSRRVMHALMDAGVSASKPQLTNLALLCAALAISADCRLGTLALALPLPGQRDSLIQRLRRMLDHPPRWDRVYRPLVVQLFRNWSAAEVPLVMDRTDLGNRMSILNLGVAYGKRLLPLVWDVLTFGGTGAATHIALLDRIAALLPPGLAVTFFGDAEFRGIDLQQYCRAHGWHWHVGMKSDVRIRTADSQAMTLADLGILPGQRLYHQHVYLTEHRPFGPVNIIADWTHHDTSPRYWALDLPADRYAWRRGRKRFWIEPCFRDWKSYGFDLEATQIDRQARIDALMVPVAITTLWMLHLGHWLTITDRRYLLEGRRKRDYSLFRLGRDWVQRARTMDWPVPVAFTVGHKPPA